MSRTARAKPATLTAAGRGVLSEFVRARSTYDNVVDGVVQ